MKSKYNNKAILQPPECKITYAIFDAADDDWPDVLKTQKWISPEDKEKKKSEPKKKKSDDPWAELKKRKKR